MGLLEALSPSIIAASTLSVVVLSGTLGIGGVCCVSVFGYLVADLAAYLVSRRKSKDEGGRAAAGATGAAISSQAPLIAAEEHSNKRKRQAGAEAPSPTAGGAGAVRGLRVMLGGQVCYPNAPQASEFENDFCKGKMLFLLRQEPENPRYAKHFEGTTIRFEMQIQAQIKKPVTGELYMGGELAERPQWGFITQTLSKVVMSFARQLVKSLHYSLGDKRPTSAADAEAVHCTFPLWRVMDWIVVTPLGTSPPPLGGKILEDPEERAARRAGKTPNHVYRTDSVYTMSFHSGLIDFQRWAVVNVPGQGSIDLKSFLGDQPIEVVVYDFLGKPDAPRHPASEKRDFFRCLLLNDEVGTVATADMATASQPAAGAASDPLNTAESTDVLEGELESEGSGDAATATAAPTALPSLTPEEETALGLVKSRDILPLLAAAAAAEGGAGLAGGGKVEHGEYLGDGPNNAAVALPTSGVPAGIQLIKAGGSAANYQSDHLHNGDVVVVYHAGNNRFLQVGRAWALVWHRGRPSSTKGHFVISNIVKAPKSSSSSSSGSGNSDKASSHVDSAAALGRLCHGDAFTLTLRKWPEYCVGIGRGGGKSNSSKPLVCFNAARRKPGSGGAGAGSSASKNRIQQLTLSARPWMDSVAGGFAAAAAAAAAVAAAAAAAAAMPMDADSPAGGRGFGAPFPLDGSSSGSDADPDENAEGEQELGNLIGAMEGEGDGLPDDEGFANGKDARRVSGGGGSSAGGADVDEVFPVEAQGGAATTAAAADLGGTLPSHPLSAAAAAAKEGLARAIARKAVAGDYTLKIDVPAWVRLHHARRKGPQDAYVMRVRSRARGVEWCCLRTGKELSSVLLGFKAAATRSAAAAAAEAAAARAAGSNRGGGGGGGNEAAMVRAAEAAAAAAAAAVVAAEAAFNRGPLRAVHHLEKDDCNVRVIGQRVAHLQWVAGQSRRGNSGGSGGGADANGPQQAKEEGSNSAGETGRIAATAAANAVASLDVSPGAPPQLVAGSTTSSFTAAPPAAAAAAAAALPAKPAAAAELERKSADGAGQAATAAAPAEDVAKAANDAYRALCQLVGVASELDALFMCGDVGATVVKAQPPVAPRGQPPPSVVLEAAVSRAFWDTHWREEWAVLYPAHLDLYSPHAHHPSRRVLLADVSRAVPLPEDRCPLPGTHALRLETSERCHYLAFASRQKRDAWQLEISRAAAAASDPTAVDAASAVAAAAAALADADAGDLRESTHAVRSGRWRGEWRLVLNCRRMAFDLDKLSLRNSVFPADSTQAAFSGSAAAAGVALPAPAAAADGTAAAAAAAAAALSAELLRAAFALPTEPGPRQLALFLDLAAALKAVDPEALPLGSVEALCFWSNVYHALVRHASLVTGPVNPKDWAAALSSMCYEVGADVFSAVEIECCVLRGRLSRVQIKSLPKHMPPPPPEGDEHYRFALTRVDARINFLLNCGSQSNPPDVPLLTPSRAEEQINRACVAFCAHTIKVDAKRKHVYFHRVCDMYANDFGKRGDPMDALRYSLRFADDRLLSELSPLLDRLTAASIKHHPFLLKGRTDLSLFELTA